LELTVAFPQTVLKTGFLSPLLSLALFVSPALTPLSCWSWRRDVFLIILPRELWVLLLLKPKTGELGGFKTVPESEPPKLLGAPPKLDVECGGW
jgi:hypothetical protein